MSELERLIFNTDMHESMLSHADRSWYICI